MPLVLTPDGLADLATIPDLEDYLGRNLTPEEVLRAPALLAGASASVRRVSGQWFTLAVSTERVRPRCGTVRLSQCPVVDVTAAANVAGTAVSFTWDGLGPIVSVSTCYAGLAPIWREPPVDITYEHGYYPLPDDVIGLTCQIVLRCLGIQPTDAGMDSETIGTYSYRQRGDGTIGLTKDEAAAARAYRQPARPIRML